LRRGTALAKQAGDSQRQDESGVAEAHAEIVIEPGLLFSMENEAGKVSPAS
jgi:hypothetical protein